MFQTDSSVYIGGEKEGRTVSFICEKNFFLILSVDEGLTKEKLKEFLSEIKKEVLMLSFDKLMNFENFLTQKLKEENFPVSASLSAGFLKDNGIIYLKTVGEGEVYIYRQGRLVPIVNGGLSASGFLRASDLIIFTTKKFIENINGVTALKQFLNDNNPHKIVDAITVQLNEKNVQGTIALFVYIKKEEKKERFKLALTEKIFNLYENYRDYSKKVGQRKSLTLLAVIVIFSLLIWSVGLGVSRRKEAAVKEKIAKTKQQILEKINQAKDSAFFNLSSSYDFLGEAKKDITNLEKEVGERKEVVELKQIVKEAETQIFKKEEKKEEEFFDLAVDSPKAKGERFYLEGDNLAILDRQQGVVYFLSLAKRSLDKVSFDKLKNASLLALWHANTIFYLKDEGFYKIDSLGNLNLVVEKDSNWGNIVDFSIYNGNLYLLDEEKSEIYKYLPADSRYSPKISYFKGGSFGLKGANSLTIDGSVYVGFSDHIFKFTLGQQENFTVSFPEGSVNLTKIFTNKDQSKLYAWEKTKGLIYVLEKDGRYQKEITAYILKKANDFVIYQNKAYLLVGSKIYTVFID